MAPTEPVLECVINVSEGRSPAVLDSLTEAGGRCVLDVHHDGDHHRAVFTLGGPASAVEAAARALTTAAVERLDLRGHEGAHPRFGVVDVVPFVPWKAATLEDAVAARNRFAAWAGDALAVPCFLYGPGRSLPDIRREAFVTVAPDTGPDRPHPTAGAMAVGARPVLVAYNLWLAAPEGSDNGDLLIRARRVARAIRGPAVRALGLAVGDRVQVSCNLVAPDEVGPRAVYEEVSRRAAEHGDRVEATELVGLVPAAVLDQTPAELWATLDLAPDKTIEARLMRAGLDGGSSVERAEERSL